MAARKTLARIVRSLLVARLRKKFGRGVRVIVEKSDYRDFIHVDVITAKFKGWGQFRRHGLIWEWLESELTREEQGKVARLGT